MKTIIKSDIVSALKSVGLQNGDSVMVHTSLGQIGYVCGGAQTIIEALIDVVGQNGTIMMPTQSWRMETLYVDGEDFKDIGRAFEVAYTTCKVKVGNADIKLMNQRELVDFAVSWIECNRK